MPFESFIRLGYAFYPEEKGSLPIYKYFKGRPLSNDVNTWVEKNFVT